MSKNSIFNRFMSLLFLVGLCLGVLVQHQSAKIRSLELTRNDLASDLTKLQALTWRQKHSGEVRGKIEAILEPFSDKLDVPPAEIAHIIFQKSVEYRIDPLLILGLIKTESDFYSEAVSHKGARGLMQLLVPTGMEVAQEMNIQLVHNEGLYNGTLNITLGVHYLAKLLDRFDGNLKLALEAYNQGPATVLRKLRDGSFEPTNYSERVLRYYRKYSDERIASIAM